MAFGSEENNWLRQVGSYWGIATSFLVNGVVSEKLFFEPAFCGELYFMFAKVRPFLKELREKTKNPDLFLLSEKAILDRAGSRAIRKGGTTRRDDAAAAGKGPILNPVQSGERGSHCCVSGRVLCCARLE